VSKFGSGYTSREQGSSSAKTKGSVLILPPPK
jgi:hypothetical protein